MNNPLVKGVSYDEREYLWHKDMQGIYQELGMSNELMKCGMREIIQRVDQVGRKERRKRIQRSMAMLANGQIAVMDFFDDGTQSAGPFILNLHGP